MKTSNIIVATALILLIYISGESKRSQFVSALPPPRDSNGVETFDLLRVKRQEAEEVPPEASEPEAEGAEPEADAEEQEAEAAEPEAEAEEPEAEAAEQEAVEQEAGAEEPEAEEEEPEAEEEEPALGADEGEPLADAEEAAAEVEEPAAEAEEPADDAEEPAADAEEPGADPDDPDEQDRPQTGRKRIVRIVEGHVLMGGGDENGVNDSDDAEEVPENVHSLHEGNINFFHLRNNNIFLFPI